MQPYRKLTVCHFIPRRFQLYLSLSHVRQPNANLAVSLDTPLYPVKPTPATVDLVTSIVQQRSFRGVALAFVAALLLSMLVRTRLLSSAIGAIFSGIWNMFRGQVRQVVDTVRPGKEGVPMPFPKDVNEGWGVCTVRGRRRVGTTGFIQYDFDMPESDYVLPLKLGQPISLCCLADNNSVVKGTFYTYEPALNRRLGTFSVLVPNAGAEETNFALGQDTGDFVSNRLDVQVSLDRLCFVGCLDFKQRPQGRKSALTHAHTHFLTLMTVCLLITCLVAHNNHDHHYLVCSFCLYYSVSQGPCPQDNEDWR